VTVAKVGDVLVTVNERKWTTWGTMERDGATLKVHVDPSRRYKVTAVGLQTADGQEAVRVTDAKTGASLVVCLADMN
jgi:hypothetical protein